MWAPSGWAAWGGSAWESGSAPGAASRDDIEADIRAYVAEVAGRDPRPATDHDCASGHSYGCRSGHGCGCASGPDRASGHGCGSGDQGSAGGGVSEVDWSEEDAAFNAVVTTDDLDPAAYIALMDEVALALDGGPHWFPTEELSRGLTGARRGLARATLTAEDAVTVQDGDLTGAIDAFGTLHTQLGAFGFTLAREAAARGLHTASALSLVDWLRLRCPFLSLTDAAHIKDVVTASQSAATAQLADFVAAGQIPLHRAALVGRTMKRLASSLYPDEQEAYATIATNAAARKDLTDPELAKVCHALIEQLLDEKKPKERERAAHALRPVTTRKVGRGLTRFTIDAPDGAAAAITGILTSALAAPAPVKDSRGQITSTDDRTPTQRRFDALMTVVNRGLGHPGAPPSTARAAVILTIPVDPATGTQTGPATTATGDYVSPAAAAQAACTADITPVWVTPDGEPLTLGRTARFASPAQWKALAVRDGGCTYPGCSAPPQWCDSHHLTHWARGGPTDTTNLALLCGRHHTHVHHHDLTATLHGGTVTWHL